MAKSATTLSLPVLLSVSISYWVIVLVLVVVWNTTNTTSLVHDVKQEKQAAITEANFEEVAVAPPTPVSSRQKSVDTQTNSIESQVQVKGGERIAVETGDDKARELPLEEKETQVSEDQPSANNEVVTSDQRTERRNPNPESDRPSTFSGDFKIVAGETAPRYCLLDQRSVECLLNRYSGRLLLTDGSHAFDIGNDIRNPIENTSSINSDKWWDANYSTRVALIPNSYGFNRVIDKLPRLPIRRDACGVALAVPHRVDRSIFEAQINFFQGEEVDVNATTIIEVDYSGIRVVGLLKQVEQ
jgi:hypothetical protein